MKLLILNKKALYLILLVLLLLIVVPIISLQAIKSQDVFKEDIFYRGTKDEKTVAFACNVDWGNEYIEEMLEIFKKNDIKITYFPTGKWAENNQEVLKLIASEGHEIGNHGYNHIDYNKLNFEQNYEEIKKADLIIEDIIGKSPRYFAPPSGAFNDNTIDAAQELNYKVIMWSVDTIDWRQDSLSNVIVSRVMEKVHNSAIVLMHPTAETNKALPIIIERLLNEGYKIGGVKDVL